MVLQPSSEETMTGNASDATWLMKCRHKGKNHVKAVSVRRMLMKCTPSLVRGALKELEGKDLIRSH
jgi:hypothetical protein